MGVRFQILGPLRVRAAGRWVPVTAAQQRLVLAVLLTDAGQAVSTERLVDAVWGDSPPKRAANAVHGYVMRLRRLLGDGMLLTRDHGYELVVRRDEVDAAVFERLVAAGRRELDGGRPGAGADCLARGLALCRGPTFADVRASPALMTLVARLEQLRLAAEEDLGASLLALDRHTEAVERLHHMVDDQPLREHRWALLMQALHRCGRRAEALQVFQRARAVLRDELGLAPGPELRGLQQAILDDDPLPVSAATPRHVPIPAQLPADVTAFTGRNDLLRKLDALLPTGDDPATAAVVISAIAGAAGVGKTALAVHWARLVSARFPDGHLFVNLRGWADDPPMRPAEALARLLRGLNVPPEDIPSNVDEASALLRGRLAGKRMLVLLDNARDPDQVRPLLPGDGGCLALVTSRDRLGGLVARDGAVPLELDVLSPDEAHELLARLLGADRVAAQPVATADLARLCGHLPLALRIAAANLATRPCTSIAQHAARLGRDRLGGLEAPGDPHNGVRAAFDTSYAALPTAARRLFRLLGVAPGPDITAAAAAALSGSDLQSAQSWLERLVTEHLVDEHAHGRYTLHDLLRTYAIDIVRREEPEAQHRAALDRLLDYYQRHTDALAEALYPQMLRLPHPHPHPHPSAVRFPRAAEAAAWADAERANLVAAVVHAARHGPRQAASRLADGLRGHLTSRISIADWQVMADAAMTAATAERDQQAMAAAYLNLAGLHSARGRHKQAISAYQQAADHARQARWSQCHAAAIGNIGYEYEMLGELAPAAEFLSQSLAIRRRLGWSSAEAGALDNLGVVYGRMGQLERAAQHHAEAAAIYRDQGALPSEARATHNLAFQYLMLGRHDEALALLTAAIATLATVGDRLYLGYAQSDLADVHRHQDNLEEARTAAESARLIAADAADHTLESMALAALASTYQQLGHLQHATNLHQQALALARNTNDRYQETDVLVRLAGVHHGAGRPEPSADLVKRALDLARRGGYRLLEGQALTVLAAIHLTQGHPEAAVDVTAQALRIHTETGHRLGQAQTHLVASHVLRRTGRTADADNRNAVAHALFGQIGISPAAHITMLIGGPESHAESKASRH